jgi:SARP family transcriptional regulator, regulator of embCAB operon
MPLRIYVTGRVAVEYGGKLLEQDAFPGKQGLLAFVRLLFTRETAVSRDELALVLWPEGLPRAWDAALNSIASKLRVLLAQTGLNKSTVLPAALSCYQLNLPTDTWVDIEVATDSLHAAEGMLKAGQHREAWSNAQVAYHICKRPFLPGETGSWAAQQRERLALSFARAGECLTEIYIWNGEPSVAVDVATQVVAEQPFRETGYQLLMRAHAAAGNRAEALWVYERCRKLISDELGVVPSPETSAVFLEILHMR